MKFFFSNLPPRNARKPDHQSTETVKMKAKDPSLEKPGLSPAKTRGRGRKRQCISTPENRFAPQDQLRRGSSTSTGSLQVSGLDLPRESVCEESVISVSIPCSNPFELLTTLCDPDQDAGDARDTEAQSDPPPQCPRCVQPLRSISSFPDFPRGPSGVKAYTCGHKDFKKKTFVCDICRMIMCTICLESESFINSLRSKENDQRLKNLNPHQ